MPLASIQPRRRSRHHGCRTATGIVLIVGIHFGGRPCTAPLFQLGRSQAIRLPKQYRFRSGHRQGQRPIACIEQFHRSLIAIWVAAGAVVIRCRGS